MKHPECDSPFELVVSDITTQMAQNIDEMCWQAVQRVGINIDKEKLLIALRQDSERYREAYAKGYATGYENRADEIVHCKDCIYAVDFDCFAPLPTGYSCEKGHGTHTGDWHCADGKRAET